MLVADVARVIGADPDPEQSILDAWMFPCMDSFNGLSNLSPSF
jgi:hypothetical protein